MKTTRIPVSDLRIGHQILRGQLWYEVRAINSIRRSNNREVACRRPGVTAISFTLASVAKVEVAQA